MDVLLARQVIEEGHQSEPHGEIKSGANAKARLSQIGGLHLRERFCFELFWVEPSTVKMLHAKEKNGQKQNGQERQRTRGGFEGTTNQDAPLAASQVLQHQQAQRAERKTQNEHVTHEVSAEKS